MWYFYTFNISPHCHIKHSTDNSAEQTKRNLAQLNYFKKYDDSTIIYLMAIFPNKLLLSLNQKMHQTSEITMFRGACESCPSINSQMNVHFTFL